MVSDFAEIRKINSRPVARQGYGTENKLMSTAKSSGIGSEKYEVKAKIGRTG